MHRSISSSSLDDHCHAWFAEIGSEESYHSGAIRLLAYISKDASPYYGKSVLQVTTSIAAAKNKLANATLTYPIVTSQGGSAFANGDMNGMHSFSCQCSKPAPALWPKISPPQLQPCPFSPDFQCVLMIQWVSEHIL